MQRSVIVTTAYSPACDNWNAGIAFLILNDLRFNAFFFLKQKSNGIKS
jgi:hypothetical protein